MAIMSTTQKVTRYTVSAVPEGLCVDGYMWDLTVEYRGDDRWAVCHGPFCLNRKGEMVSERQPSSRTDRWLESHRFTEQEALRLAHQHAPNVCINNLTPADLLAKYDHKANR